MVAVKRKSPGNAPHAPEARYKKQRTHGTASWWWREAVASITVGLLVAVVMWSAILGMSEGFQPGNEIVVPPIAEADHA
jgi:hypothetical protein